MEGRVAYETTHPHCRYLVSRWMLLYVFVSIILLEGCGKNGPASTNSTSAGFTTLKERVDFLQRYVNFRRTYESLDFAIQYSNNSGGGVPAPSDWDIRFVAIIPAAEISAWLPAGAAGAKPDTDWLKSVPTSQDLSGVNEWYINGQQTLGLDRAKRIVVYRSEAH